MLLKVTSPKALDIFLDPGTFDCESYGHTWYRIRSLELYRDCLCRLVGCIYL